MFFNLFIVICVVSEVKVADMENERRRANGYASPRSTSMLENVAMLLR